MFKIFLQNVYFIKYYNFCFFYIACHSHGLLFKLFIFFAEYNQVNGFIYNMMDHYYLNDYSKSSHGVTLTHTLELC